MSDPMFKTLKDAERVIKSNEYISAPIFNADGDLVFNIQVLAKKKRNSKFSAGFALTDQVLFDLFVNIL